MTGLARAAAVVLVGGALPAFCGGCAAQPRSADLSALYGRAAQAPDDDRTPVVVIPGILGSRLVDTETGTLVWGAFSGEFADPATPEGVRLIAHPMLEGAALRDIPDTIRDDGALDRVKVNVLGIPLSLTAYYEILATLGVGGYQDRDLAQAGAIDYGSEHFTCDQFAYDWRRDIVEAARQLADQVEAMAVYSADLRGQDEPVKVALVAHSMGGMVARYYLRYGRADLPADGSPPEVTWAGAEYVSRLIMVGTPNTGSAAAIKQLVEGTQLAPLLPSYPPALLGTMPSIYQLMPRDRHGPLVDGESGERIERLYDPAFWEEMNWGLADPEQAAVLRMLLPDARDDGERRRIALDHLRKCLDRAERLHRALDTPAAPPPGLRISLIAGDAEKTPAVVAVDARTGSVRYAANSPGDGTVTRASALADEREGGAWTPRLRTPIAFDEVMFLFRDHIGLTKDPAFADNVLFRLLEMPGVEGP